MVNHARFSVPRNYFYCRANGCCHSFIDDLQLMLTNLQNRKEYKVRHAERFINLVFFSKGFCSRVRCFKKNKTVFSHRYFSSI